MWRDIAVYSDLHLGDGGPSDDFCGPAWSDYRTVCAAEYALADSLWRDYRAGRIIVLNGDTVDGPIAAIECVHPVVCTAIKHCVKRIIRGNHDRYAYKFCGHETVGGHLDFGDLRVMHGHQFDVFNHGPLKVIGMAGAALGTLAEVLIHPDADEWLDDKVAKWLGKGRYGDPDAYRKACMAYLAKHHEVQRLVIGHTHRFEPFCNGYANSGTWTGGRRDVLRTHF